MKTDDYEYEQYYDYDECDDYGFEKLKHNAKPKRKGHQSKHQGNKNKWNYDNDDLYSIPTIPVTTQHYVKPKEIKPKEVFTPVANNMTNTNNVSVNATTNTSTKTFTPGPNSHTIKNVIIDFDRVINMEKVSGQHNNIMTYGIKFYFKSKNNTCRIIWFNRNERERDNTFNTEYGYWKTLS